MKKLKQKNKMIPIARPFLGEEEINAVAEALKSGIIAQGPKVNELEDKFAKVSGTKYAVALNSGTAALHTALKVAGIKEDDGIITTPFTFIATANTILMQRAKPIFVDIEEDTFNIDAEKISDKITKKARAIVTVDLFGHLCDYDAIHEIAEKNNLNVIEDACQAVDAEYKNKRAGSFGDIAAFSFYATKNITCAEGGMMATDSKEFADKAKLFRQHGRTDMVGYDYNDIGYNYRMTDISAAILLEQLKKLDLLTKKRIENADYLGKGLSKVKGIKVPVVKRGHKHVFHQYTIKVDGFRLGRDELAKHLKSKGIASSVFYPKPLHLCEHIKKIGYRKGDFPAAEKLSEQVLSLPVHPHLAKEQLDYIIKTIAELE